MSGGGPSSTTATSATKSSPWGPSSPYGELYLAEMGNTLFPGAFPTPSIPQLGIGGSTGNALPSLPQMPASLNQQVAPLTSAQTSALQGISNITPQAMNLTGLGAGSLASFASGNQQNNPYLNSLYNQAAGQLTNQYQNATMPGIMANAAQTGSVGGTGYNTGIQQAQYGLGQGLASLGANIYEPAYAQGQQNMLTAATALPNAAMSLYSPLSAQYGAGTAQQQQNQNVLNTNYQNALSATQYPFAMLSELGGAFGATAGAGGTTVGQQPVFGGSSGAKL